MNHLARILGSSLCTMLMATSKAICFSQAMPLLALYGVTASEPE
jgi:hypothetical protein